MSKCHVWKNDETKDKCFKISEPAEKDPCVNVVLEQATAQTVPCCQKYWLEHYAWIHLQLKMLIWIRFFTNLQFKAKTSSIYEEKNPTHPSW